jgi:predicted transcriptional regulator
MEHGSELVAFLANSENRVRVLTALAESPRERPDLRAETGTTRATLARILGELEDRGLAHRQGGTHAATPAGRELVEAFRPLAQTAAALDALGEFAPRFPFDDVGFDARHLHDARLVRPTKADATRPMNRSLDLVGDAEQIRLVSGHHVPPVLNSIAERIAAGRLQFDAVLARDVLATVRSSDRDTDALRRLVESSHAAVAVTETDVPYNAAANDDTIVITVSDDNGVPQAMIETESPAVADWFDEFFARHRAAATPLTAADLDD